VVRVDGDRDDVAGGVVGGAMVGVVLFHVSCFIAAAGYINPWHCSHTN
jgi:hypothetical protein